jgi:hypothetical protein
MRLNHCDSNPESHRNKSQNPDCGPVYRTLVMCRTVGFSESPVRHHGCDEACGCGAFFFGRPGWASLFRARCRCARARAASPFHWREVNGFRQVDRSKRPPAAERQTTFSAAASESTGGEIDTSAGCRWGRASLSCKLVSHFLFGPWREASRRPTVAGLCQKGWRPAAPCPIRCAQSQWGACVSIVLG